MAVPLNEVIATQTTAYLAGIDPANPPTPRTIESDLLARVNDQLEIENLAHHRKNQQPYLKTLNHFQISAVLMHLHNICRIAPAGKNTDADYDLVAMYMNDGPDAGIYVTSEDTFRSIARQYNNSLTTNEFREILAAIKDAAPRKYRCQERDLIAVNNGVFDYEKKTLLPFTPDRVFLSKSRVDYVPGAHSPVITHPDDGTVWEVEEWMNTLSDDPEVVELLWEILGAIIRPHVRWNKSAWFYSVKGNNGKGTLCELMRNLCGPTSYASIPIADFGKDFLLEPLTRASAIIVDENDVGTFIDRAANLKAVITNDVISINRKFKTPIAYQFYGFMVQCLNEFPRIKDKSESFYRRQLFVPFEKNFAEIERRYIKSDYLSRPEVLQYVLIGGSVLANGTPGNPAAVAVTPTVTATAAVTPAASTPSLSVTPTATPTPSVSATPTPEGASPSAAPAKASTQAPAPAPAPAKTTTQSRVKDSCPNGDYSGSSYDGKCGTKRAPATTKPPSTGGGFKPPPTSSSCTEGAIIKVPSQTSGVIATYQCMNGKLVKIG